MPQNNDYFETICKISKAFGTTLEKDQVLNLIVESAVEAMHVKAATLTLLDEEAQQFLVVAQKGLSENYVNTGFTEPGKIIKMLAENNYIYSREAAKDPRLDRPEAKEAEGIASILAVPVLIEDQIVGALRLYTESPREFSEREIGFATALAEQGGMAIQHARLVEKLRQNTRLFLDLTSSINSSLDIKKILHILSANVADVLKVKASSILLINEDKGTLELAASYGLSEAYLDRGPLAVERSISDTLKGDPVIIKDAVTDERIQYREAKVREGIASIVSVPIKTKEKVIGVLRLYTATPRDFTEDEIMLVTALAHQGGLAIQNASMYLVLQNDVKDLTADAWSHRVWF